MKYTVWFHVGGGKYDTKDFLRRRDAIAFAQSNNGVVDQIGGPRIWPRRLT